MDKEIAEKLKLIDDEISNALDTISQLEARLATIRTDEEGKVLKDECSVLRDKFTSFNESLEKLTDMLSDLGIIDKE